MVTELGRLSSCIRISYWSVLAGKTLQHVVAPEDAPLMRGFSFWGDRDHNQWLVGATRWWPSLTAKPLFWKMALLKLIRCTISRSKVWEVCWTIWGGWRPHRVWHLWWGSVLIGWRLSQDLSQALCLVFVRVWEGVVWRFLSYVQQAGQPVSPGRPCIRDANGARASRYLPQVLKTTYAAWFVCKTWVFPEWESAVQILKFFVSSLLVGSSWNAHFQISSV